jgi:type I restriction enzyme S subunit
MNNQALLGDVCDFLDHKRKPVTEGLRTSGPYPYYGANGQQGWIDDYLFDEPLVLLAEDGGHFGSATKPIAYKIHGKTWVNNHAHVLRPRPECDIDFLAHVLSFFDVSKFVNGSTRPKLTKGNAEQIRIPLPPLSKQRHLAKLLGQAERIRRMRRYALQMCDELPSALFWEIFGDLRCNPQDYEVRALGDICDVRDGTHDSPKFHREGIPLVTSKNLTNGFVDLSEVDLISEEDYEKVNRRSKVDRGDILMPMIGTIGSPVFVDREPRFAIKNVALIKFVAASPSPIYIRELLRGTYFEYLISMNSRGGTQQFIALGDIRGFRIPIAPTSVQQQFVELVARQEQLRATHIEALRQADHLFQTLLHQAFSTQ